MYWAFEYVADGLLGVVFLNSTDFSVTNGEAFSFAVNISCAVGGNNCGQVNVTLDPLRL